MNAPKFALLGAGSFVFGPSVLHDLLEEHRWDGCELALMDVDQSVADLMAGVARQMARRQGMRVRVTATTRRTEALAGADFVLCCAARQIGARFATDVSLIERHVPGHLVSEFGGVAGISYSLRQLALMDEIVTDLRACCPEAWFFSVSNPLPRLIQLAVERDVRAVGFCSAMLWGYRTLWSLFHDGERLEYPYAAALQRWSVLAGGTNHLTWLVELRERATGADALPALRARLAAGATAGEPLSEALCRETGYLPLAGDGHIRDFLPPRACTTRVREASHGNAEARAQRLALLRAVADGSADPAALAGHGSWEKPIDLAAAIAKGKHATFPALNLPNHGQMPELPPGAIVETPCEADTRGPLPQTVRLPAEVVGPCLTATRLTDRLVRAWRERSTAHLLEALEMDPTVLPAERAGARAALQACLQAHADVLPDFPRAL